MVELGSTGACGISPAIRVALSVTQVIHFFKPDRAVWLVFIIQGSYLCHRNHFELMRPTATSPN